MMDEKLIALAETLNKARIQANDHEITAPQHGVYGEVTRSLKTVLFVLVGIDRSELAYQALLDGSDVRQAIRYAIDQHAERQHQEEEDRLQAEHERSLMTEAYDDSFRE